MNKNSINAHLIFVIKYSYVFWLYIGFNTAS